MDGNVAVDFLDMYPWMNDYGVIGARCHGPRFRGLYALQERGGW